MPYLNHDHYCAGLTGFRGFLRGLNKLLSTSRLVLCTTGAGLLHDNLNLVAKDYFNQVIITEAPICTSLRLRQRRIR
jgi:hypothetical protein